MALVHQHRAVVEEQKKTNKHQSGVIEELTMTTGRERLIRTRLIRSST